MRTRLLIAIGLVFALIGVGLYFMRSTQISSGEASDVALIISVPSGYDERSSVIDVIRETDAGGELDKFDEDDRFANLEASQDKSTKLPQVVYAAAFRKSNVDAAPTIALIIFGHDPESTLIEFRQSENNADRISKLQEDVVEAIYERWPKTHEIPITPGPIQPLDSSEYTEI